jgi:hypothetical protein
VERVERQGTYYGSNSTLLAQSDEYADCGVVVAPLDPGTYWLHVEGNISYVNGSLVPAEGSFELAVLCQENPSLAALVDPSPCAYDYLTCGDSVVGSTVGKPNMQGNASGDVYYLLSVFGPQSVYLTTCTKFTTFDAVITVYKDYPSDASVASAFSQVPQSQWHSSQGDGCSRVNIDFKVDDFDGEDANGHFGGGFWVAVDGVGDSEGAFELVVQCSPGPTVSPTVGATPYPTHGACDYTEVACGADAIASSTAYYGNFGGGPAKEQNFVVTIAEPTRLVADTCREAKMNTTVWLYDGCPADGGKPIGSSGNASGACLGDFSVYTPGSYWLLVEAVGGIEDFGDFQLALSCTVPPSPAPTLPPSSLPTLLPTLSLQPTQVPTPVPIPNPSLQPTRVPS